MAQPYIIIPAQGSDPADEWLRLGVESQVAGQLPTAQQRYTQALRIDPRHAIALNNLAVVFAQSNFLNEALLTIERASMFNGSHACIQTNWALMALDSDRIEEAIQASKRALAIAPDDVGAMMAYAMVSSSAGNPSESVAYYNRILDKEPTHGAAGPNSCFAQTLIDSTPEELLEQRKRWYEANRFRGVIESHGNDRNPDRPLRVGYVGGDFKSHSAAFIFGRVVLHHSSAIETYLYSSLPVNPTADGMTKKFMDVAGQRWRDISSVDDESAARLIRNDRIDILVDLAGHTNGGRLALFTRKPSPVQVTGWGFAHGTGCPEIDYFIADPVSVPKDERQYYAEKIFDLPCLITIEEPSNYNLKGTSLPPIKKNGYITFGMYARYEKISDKCLSVLAEILRRVPDSKLEFKDNGFRRPYSIRRVMAAMPDIDPERLLFSTTTSHSDHMLAYQQIDLILDPFPHCGGVVSLEQLYMGVPIITLYGKQPSGRNTSSVLTAMNRTEWIANTTDEYIAKAVEWSGRQKEFADARKKLRQELLDSSVVKGYVECVENAYRQMWREWCN